MAFGIPGMILLRIFHLYLFEHHSILNVFVTFFYSPVGNEPDIEYIEKTKIFIYASHAVSFHKNRWCSFFKNFLLSMFKLLICLWLKLNNIFKNHSSLFWYRYVSISISKNFKLKQPGFLKFKNTDSNFLNRFLSLDIAYDFLICFNWFTFVPFSDFPMIYFPEPWCETKVQRWDLLKV